MSASAFSGRVGPLPPPNAIARAEAAARERYGDRFIDLTLSNPTRAAIPVPPDLLAPLADPCALVYEPDPFGLPSAREAVARRLASGGRPFDPARLVLSASTSEAYGLLFKLLCEPGDEVLVPQPSYPLFEHLAGLEAVKPVSYALEYHGLWVIDRERLERAVTPRTRAVIVVSPNNPTGSWLRATDGEWLVRFAADRDLAVVADEVFEDYPLEVAADAIRLLDLEPEGLCVSLGGLSKSLGLPQLKLGWMAFTGSSGVVGEAMRRMELIADTYLSVNTPVQVALPKLFETGATIREAIRARLARNLEVLRRSASGRPALEVLRVEGGWSAVVRIPAIRPEEEVVLDLLQSDGVLVHPGYFFDFPGEAFLVLSLLPEEARFADAVDRVCARTAGA